MRSWASPRGRRASASPRGTRLRPPPAWPSGKAPPQRAPQRRCHHRQRHLRATARQRASCSCGRGRRTGYRPGTGCTSGCARCDGVMRTTTPRSERSAPAVSSCTKTRRVCTTTKSTSSSPEKRMVQRLLRREPVFPIRDDKCSDELPSRAAVRVQRSEIVSGFGALLRAPQLDVPV